LRESGPNAYSYVIPCLIHLIDRYWEISEVDFTLQPENAETEDANSAEAEEFTDENYFQALRNRKISDECFKLMPIEKVVEMSSLIQKGPEEYFLGIDKKHFISKLNNSMK
jgi:hypothetical protein